MAEPLEKVEIKKVIGPTSAGAAILLGNERKTFVVYIGINEAMALLRELKNESTSRPLTHDLIQSIFLGFDLAIKKIVISNIIDNAFCATLILEQRINDKDGEWAGRRNEVRIDARPSDCMVLALKNKADIFVTEEVFAQVQDFSEIALEDSAMTLGASEVEALFGGYLRGRGTGGAESEEEEDLQDGDEDEEEDESP